MKKIEGWQCDNCSKLHNTELGAVNCENEHAFRLHSAKITGSNFRDSTRTYGFEQAIANEYPKNITIRFSENSGDFASYILDHVGYRSV
jgi:hypothetical protein